MQHMEQNAIANEFRSFIGSQEFPCVAARHAVAAETISIMTAGDLACPFHDRAILDFIYGFIKKFRENDPAFFSVAIVFTGPGPVDEDKFETLMWNRLNALRKLDAAAFPYDARVSDDPTSPEFSFSLMEEAFFVLGMHPGASRTARRSARPALVFNPHAQFEKMRQTSSYDKMKAIVRKRDTVFSGSVNPMLTDFRNKSEAFQYSGQIHTDDWQCPFKKQ